MQEGQDTIPLSRNLPKNLFPGAVAFIETFDADEDPAESADVLSFESLREAFATLHSSETELAKTIPKIELSAGKPSESLEQPDYELNDTTDDVADLEEESDVPSPSVESSATVGICLDAIIEAMLFVGNREERPLEAEQIVEKLRNVSAEEADQTVRRLNEHYQERNCPYTILSECGGYRMVLRSEFESVRTNFYGKIRETRLSQLAIDTLAVVAYRQPITAEEIQNIRQQSSATVLNQLVRRNLLRITREVRGKKNVVCYHTTPRFLELFQIKSLDDIPKADELDDR